MEPSNAQVRAGVFFTSSSMRYAELERQGDSSKLLRLGSCDFSFNPLNELSGQTDENLANLTDAVAEVFVKSRASRIHVSLHPRLANSFFSPVANSLSRKEARRQIAEEARLIYPDKGAAGIISRKLDNVVVSGGSKHAWVHITAVPSLVRNRLQQLMRGLSDKVCVGIPLAESIVPLLSHSREVRTAAYVFLVGLFEGRLELLLCKRGRLHYAQSISYTGAPSDAIYWATSLCQRLRVSAKDLDVIHMFGEKTDRTVERLLAGSFEAQVQELDPLRAIVVDPGRFSSDFNHGAFAPCIGVAI